MFANTPLEEIDFDFDSSNIMYAYDTFKNCTKLKTCTSAKFKNGGTYLDLFKDARFDESSARIICTAARDANVMGVSIGIAGEPS
jgi:hypothetical protein